MVDWTIRNFAIKELKVYMYIRAPVMMLTLTKRSRRSFLSSLRTRASKGSIEGGEVGTRRETFNCPTSFWLFV